MNLAFQRTSFRLQAPPVATSASSAHTSAPSAFTPLGFTLLETLAAVTLLSLAAVLGVGVLLGAGDRASIEQAVASVLATDADARTLALTGGPVRLAANDDQDELHILVGRGVVMRRPMPPQVTVHLLNREDDPLEAIEFDSRGRSMDYQIALVHDEERVVIRITGLTGWVEVTAP